MTATIADVLAVFRGEITGPDADAIMASYLEPRVTSYFAPGPEPCYDTPQARAEAGPEPEAEP